MNYYQSKNHKQIYKMKKLLYKTIGRLRIKTPRRALESSLHFLTVQERWEWIILAVWIAHFFLFYFCFVTNLRKKFFWRTYAYSWTSSSPYTIQFVFSWTTLPPPCVLTLWMTPRDNSHSRESNIVTLFNNFFLTLCWLTLNNSVIIKAIKLTTL